MVLCLEQRYCFVSCELLCYDIGLFEPEQVTLNLPLPFSYDEAMHAVLSVLQWQMRMLTLYSKLRASNVNMQQNDAQNAPELTSIHCEDAQGSIGAIGKARPVNKHGSAFCCCHWLIKSFPGRVVPEPMQTKPQSSS